MKRRFVIQEHHSKRLHFDLRLEVDGIAKSWAVPKGPTMTPGVRRLAVAGPDHPMSSMAFEGTRKTGLYGAGEVCIWDKGEFEAVLNIQSFLDKGWLAFTLHGRKLKGRFLMERWTNNYFNWTLFKLEDEHADPDFELETMLKPRQAVGFLPLLDSVAC